MITPYIASGWALWWLRKDIWMALTLTPISTFLLHARNDPGVSCGIPDFRSRNGLYASLQENGEYDLDDPQQM